MAGHRFTLGGATLIGGRVDAAIQGTCNFKGARLETSHGDLASRDGGSRNSRLWRTCTVWIRLLSVAGAERDS
jgi:hypothetical protein